MIACIVSPYSFEGSILRLEEVVNAAKSFGLKSLMLADQNFHACVHFNKICRSNGIIPVHALRIDKKIFYAQDRNQYEELIKAYNESSQPKTPWVNIDSVKLIYYLRESDYEAHAFLCQLLSVQPKKGAYFENNLTDVANALNCKPYDLKVQMSFPKPEKGWLRNFSKKVPPGYQSRFESEVEIIEKMNLESYFYTVKKIVDTARSMNICVGPGRGSAVGSLVAFILGITQIDPVKHDLLFERFLNEYRQEPPDIDIDVEDRKRSMLIEQLIRVFPFCAQISSFSTLSLKSINAEARRLNLTIKDEHIKLLNKLPYRRSVHAAGLIIANEVLNLPMVRDSNFRILEYDMDSLQEIGVTKIDLLGLTTLTMISNMKKTLKIDSVPVDDFSTYEMISSGKTTGIFQLESLPARSLCRQVRPREFNELSVLLAINRPGPLIARLNRIYAERKRGCNREYHEDLFPETFGVVIYQEQIMKLAMSMADMSPAESDLFRKAMSHKDRLIMKAAVEKLRNKMIDKGYSKSFVNELANILIQFSSYAFNKSHSVAYAMLSYQLAYIKNHFPKVFFQHYIKEHSNDPSKVFAAVQELRTTGFEVIQSSVNPVDLKEDQFQLPMEAIAGVGSSVVQLCQNRAPFEDIQDFAKKTSLPLSTIQRLAHAGAFDCIYHTRENSIKAFNSFQKGFDPSLLEISTVFGKRESRFDTNMTHLDILKLEEQVYGFPLTPFKTYLSRKFAPLSDVYSYARTLPVSVNIEKGYACDGLSVIRIRENLQDGEYLIILRANGSIEAHYDLSQVKSIVYEFYGCFDEKDFEQASEYEDTQVVLLGKKVLINSTRPRLESYKIRVISA